MKNTENRSIWQLEVQRYRQKGWKNVTIGAAMLFAIAYCAFVYGRQAYAYALAGDPLTSVQVYLIVVILGHTLAALCANAWYLPFYALEKRSAYVAAMRINAKALWPWEQDDWPAVRRKTVVSVLLAHFVIVPVLAFLDAYIGVRVRTDVASLPSLREFLTHIAVMQAAEDCLFYWSHYLLHTPYLYQRVHKKHHEYKNTTTFAAEYSNPIEFVLGNVVPAGFGAKVLGARAHVFTLACWVFWRLFTTTDAHSGFEVPWHPARVMPLCGSALFHGYHHSHNDGTYGSYFTFWDTVMGTAKNFYKHRDDYFKRWAVRTTAKVA